MQAEIEAKWINIDVELLRKKLIEVGAELMQSERLMKRQTFDFPDKRLDKIGGWVRIRDEGDKVTMSYKQLNDRTVNGTKEVSIVVNNFDEANNLLISIGLESKSFQETKRESWKLGDSQIEIDTWPWIPSFVEIESANEDELKSVANTLGLDFSKALHGSVEPAYQAVYDVSDAEINSWKEIRFGAVPDWLASKIKKA